MDHGQEATGLVDGNDATDESRCHDGLGASSTLFRSKPSNILGTADGIGRYRVVQPTCLSPQTVRSSHTIKSRRLLTTRAAKSHEWPSQLATPGLLALQRQPAARSTQEYGARKAPGRRLLAIGERTPPRCMVRFGLRHAVIYSHGIAQVSYESLAGSTTSTFARCSVFSPPPPDRNAYPT